jgi:hypothetical protein
MRRTSRVAPLTHALKIIAFTFLAGLSSGFAQSRDVNYPTPVTANEIAGRIAPRDIGDARLTRHFYTFTGIEGDLLITVESTDLNGDIDLFAADSLRPLTKITLYAGSSASTVTKSVYLRTQEPLVLRVEGRTAGETDAAYRIRFEGAFSPSTNALAQAPETPTLSEPTGDRNTSRVNSVGARIAEPPTEAAAQSQPDAPPGTEAEAVPTPTPDAARETAEAATRRPARRGASQPRRNRPARPSARTDTRRTDRSETSDRAAEAANTDASGTAAPSSESPAADASTAGETASAPARNTKTARNRAPRRGGRNNRPAEETAAAVPSDASTAVPVEPAPAVASPRLIIVTRDGETLERDMSTVRRVTVEKNQIVVVGTDGKVTRQPMANVVRMAIEP